jgi:formate C-acetyltransferase
MVHWLLAALDGGRPPKGADGRWWSGGPVDGVPEPVDLATFGDLLRAFRRVSGVQLQRSIDARIDWLKQVAANEPFHLESLLLQGCVESCTDCYSGGTPFALHGQYFDGIATLADSLYAIKRLVYEEGRLDLQGLLDACARDYAGCAGLREEIAAGLPKFGNDCRAVDAVAKEAADIVLDAMEAVDVPSDRKVVGGFYSLHNHHAIGRELGATPDGRRAGEPVSENQSPTYGADTEGITALLKSVARLPLERTAQGGLNVTFGGSMPAEKLRSLIDTYFAMGGVHVGFTFVDRPTLEDARRHPDRYRTLTVRLYGFSEYFVALSEHEQQELVERTRY